VRSRRGRRHYPTMCRQLHDAGLDLLDLHPVADPRHLPQALAAAVDSGADLIVVGGGDGTLSLPLHLPAALHILTEGKVADVDLGHVARRQFANLTSLGLSVRVAQHVPHHLKRILGRAAYPLTALALLPRHRPFTAQLRVTDGTANHGTPGDHGTPGATAHPPRTVRTPPTPRTAGRTSWSPISSTSPTAATTPAGRSPATPAWKTGNW
jgi:diacylglycerol kinase family enzyme